MIPIARTYRRIPSNFLNDFFNNDYRGGSVDSEPETRKPLANISEKKERFEIQISVPGFDKTDVNVSIDKDILTISSNKNEEDTTSEKKYITKEFETATFSRSFKLPLNVESDKISATQKNGVLSVVIPKKVPVEIPVQEIAIN